MDHLESKLGDLKIIWNEILQVAAKEASVPTNEDSSDHETQEETSRSEAAAAAAYRQQQVQEQQTRDHIVEPLLELLSGMLEAENDRRASIRSQVASLEESLFAMESLLGIHPDKAWKSGDAKSSLLRKKWLIEQEMERLEQLKKQRAKCMLDLSKEIIDGIRLMLDGEDESHWEKVQAIFSSKQSSSFSTSSASVSSSVLIDFSEEEYRKCIQTENLVDFSESAIEIRERLLAAVKAGLAEQGSLGDSLKSKYKELCSRLDEEASPKWAIDNLSISFLSDLKCEIERLCTIVASREEQVLQARRTLESFWTVLRETVPAEYAKPWWRSEDPIFVGLNYLEKYHEVTEFLRNLQKSIIGDAVDLLMKQCKAAFHFLNISEEKQTEMLRAFQTDDIYTLEMLVSLRTFAEELRKKVEACKVVLRLKEERRVLIEKMIDFEKTASDPARLFRSSFQLVQEEKFRKEAFPRLINLESRLLAALDSYFKEFKERYCEGDVPLDSLLEQEIATRYINESIFEFSANHGPKSNGSAGSLASSTESLGCEESTKPITPDSANINEVGQGSEQILRNSSNLKGRDRPKSAPGNHGAPAGSAAVRSWPSRLDEAACLPYRKPRTPASSSSSLSSSSSSLLSTSSSSSSSSGSASRLVVNNGASVSAGFIGPHASSSGARRARAPIGSNAATHANTSTNASAAGASASGSSAMKKSSSTLSVTSISDGFLFPSATSSSSLAPGMHSSGTAHIDSNSRQLARRTSNHHPPTNGVVPASASATSIGSRPTSSSASAVIGSGRASTSGKPRSSSMTHSVANSMQSSKDAPAV